MTIKNFLFHRVNPERDILWDPMDVELFDKCISYIKRKYTIISVEDFTETLSDKKYATISFDDGYKDNSKCSLLFDILKVNKYVRNMSYFQISQNCF